MYNRKEINVSNSLFSIVKKYRTKTKDRIVITITWYHGLYLYIKLKIGFTNLVLKLYICIIENKLIYQVAI